MRYVRPIIKQKLRFDVLVRDSFKCQYCGIADSSSTQLVIDHIVPICDGGTNHILNLSSACVDCNSGKAGKRLLIEKMPKKLQKQLEELSSLGIKQKPIYFDEMCEESKIFEIKPSTRDDKSKFEEIVNPVINHSSFPELKKIISITDNETDPILSQINKLLVSRTKGRIYDPVKYSVGLIALSCITHKTYTFGLSPDGFNNLCKLNFEINELHRKRPPYQGEYRKFLDWALESGFIIEILGISANITGPSKFIHKFYELKTPDLVNYIKIGVLDDLIEKRLKEVKRDLRGREFWRETSSRSYHTCYFNDGDHDYDQA